MSKTNARNGTRALLCAVAGLFVAGAAIAGEDPDEAELRKLFEKVDVWHFQVDAEVRYNNQDVVVTRELVAQPPPTGELCYVRFDLVNGEGDYGYGLKPASLPGPRNNAHFGVNVLKRGTVLDQYYSALRLNVVEFYVEGPKTEDAKAVCARMQSAPTARAGNAYKGPWADLVTRARAVHGWPTPPTK